MSRAQAQVLEKASVVTKGITEEMASRSGACPLCGGSEVSDFLSAPDRFHLRRDVYHLVRCGSCSCVWLAGAPKPTEMQLHYGEAYHRAISGGGETDSARRWQKQRKRISRFYQTGAILDIGCSSGSFLATMRNGAWQLHGVEMSASMAERARTTTAAEIFVGDVLDAPFPAETFDVITSFDVLEHMYEPRAFLAKVHKWLKPGGIFYAELPNIDSWESRLFRSYWYGLELPRHLFHYSPRSLRCIMDVLGFEEVLIRTPQTTYVERSMNYICSAIAERIGRMPRPQSELHASGLAWRAVRKALRIVLVRPWALAASLAGAGGSLEILFRKKSLESGCSAAKEAPSD
jgi:2-polyprenyl-3-methyl-5-hydroxy-6-metoxy-1,4-benzoquinol methylase